MVYLIDPKDLFGNKACTFFCKGVAFPMYGVPPCADYCRLFYI
jgi:hypothetical protein